MQVSSDHSQSHVTYEPTLWAKVFHSVPHVNITFQPVNSQFNLDNELYLESLGILASVPAAWLIATLVVLLIYLCTRCCDTKSKKKRKSRPLRCCLSFFSLITCASLAAGFYGNHDLHNGFVEFEKATDSMIKSVGLTRDKISRYNEVVHKKIEQSLNLLYDGAFQRDILQDPNAHLKLMDNADQVFQNISEVYKTLDGLSQQIDDSGSKVDYNYFPLSAKNFEKYRWPATMALQGTLALFCLLLFVGAIVHSRWVLILFSVLGLFSIIILWLSASVYAATAVAVADFCYDPTPPVVRALQNTVSIEVSSYYLKCGPGITNPFESSFKASHSLTKNIDGMIKLISGIARKYYSENALKPNLDNLDQGSDEIVQLMDTIGKSLKCEHIYNSYNVALVSMCDSGLRGLIIMLLSSAMSGLLFTILVWCNSHTWIYFKHKGRYIKVDDQDPYMPLSTIERPRMGPLGGPTPVTAANPIYHRRTAHTPPQTPPYHGTLNGHQNQSPYGHLGGANVSIGPNSGTSMSNAATLGATYRTHQPYHMNNAPGKPLGNHGVGTLGNHGAGTLGNHGVGTLGRSSHHPPTYQALDNLPATMTLGRKGLYASLGAHRGRASHAMMDNDAPLLGPNMGQYATLSKQCKTLEASDFY